MWHQFKKKILQSKRAAGLQIILGADQAAYRLCQLKFDNELVTLEKCTDNIGKLSEIAGNLIEKPPLALLIQGKGISTKRILFEESEIVSTVHLVQEAWPALATKDFYIQRYDFAGGAFISLIRKETLDELLNQLISLGLQVIDVKLGIVSASYALPFINDIPEILTIDGEEILIKENEIVEAKISKGLVKAQEIKIGDDLLDAKWLTCYASALNILALNNSNPSLICDRILEFKEEWEQSHIFKIMGLTLLVTFLIVLIGNFLLFSHYQRENQRLAGEAALVVGQLNYLTTLKNKQANQKAFLTSAGWLQPTKSSYYLDRFAATVPEKVQLTEIALHPVDNKKSKREKKIVLDPGVLLVRGRCANSQVINSWIQKVSKLSWVSNISGQSYKYDGNQNTGVFEFKIIIAI